MEVKRNITMFEYCNVFMGKKGPIYVLCYLYSTGVEKYYERYARHTSLTDDVEAFSTDGARLIGDLGRYERRTKNCREWYESKVGLEVLRNVFWRSLTLFTKKFDSIYN